ncbi:MAG: type II secretion system GspH family protein [Phormidium tanganyikae FI6-MK23]|nr:type II secretion system GspH family protein [Phormidium tanganyikae FI6-MK23]
MLQAVLMALHRKQRDSRRGFTLLEAIVVVALIGILTAISAPSWLAYVNTQRLNAARSETVNVLTEAKTRAKQQHIAYEAGFRQQGQQAQWAVYPVNADPLSQNWQNLPDGVKLLEGEETTFTKKDNIYRIQFNHYGGVNGQWGRVTFSPTSGGAIKRCVIVSNLLGTVREGENRSGQNGNRCD